MRSLISPNRLIWLPSVFGRTTVLLMSLSIFTLYLYLMGNIQGFADMTLIVLFQIESWILSLTAIAGLFSSIAHVVTIPLRHRLKLENIIFSALASVLSLLIYMGVAFLQVFLEGYSGA